MGYGPLSRPESQSHRHTNDLKAMVLTKPITRPHSGSSPTASRFYPGCAVGKVFETYTGRTTALPVTPFPEIDDAVGCLEYPTALTGTGGTTDGTTGLPDPSPKHRNLRARQRTADQTITKRQPVSVP